MARVQVAVGVEKVDKAEQRAVSREEGMAFARDNGCLFLECSAKTRVSVQEAFEELVRGVLETPSLLAETAATQARNTYLISILAALFVPLSFITGLLGMNVAGIPGAETPYAFALVVGLMAAVFVAGLAVLRWRGWI